MHSDNEIMRLATAHILPLWFCLVNLGVLVHSFNINSTGGSFPTNVYQEATFAYQFTSPGDFVSYLGQGSTTGKCNIMGYWQTGNIASTQSVSVATRIRDTLICTDTCTVTTCGVNSALSPRFDSAVRVPLVDFAGSDSLLKSSDYAAFPDLQMLPALAGAAVAVYNIPELVATANISGALILSRRTIAYIFKGEIAYWNDTRILMDNPSLSGILSKISQPIRVVVRTDSSGTSEIFSSALSLFDPISSSAFSFAGTVGSGSNPLWCGSLTDEVQVITIVGCNTAHSTASKMIYMKVVDGSHVLRDVSFACDASASNITAQFARLSPGPGLSVIVRKTMPLSDVIMFTIGYSDQNTLKKNWYQPSIISTPSGVTVSVNTLQEGGYLNSHYNSTYSVTPQIQSLWIQSTAPTFSYNITWQSGISTSYQISLQWGGLSSSAAFATAVATAFNTAYPGSVFFVNQFTSTNSTWIEYRITFTSTVSPLFSDFDIFVNQQQYSNSVYITTFLDSNNYPLFYDYLHPRGYGGSGR